MIIIVFSRGHSAMGCADQRDSIRRMQCRPACAACCIAPSISSPIPGMPGGKPAGVPCVQLDAAGRCRLFGQPSRPAVCASLLPSAEMCGGSAPQALAWLARLELQTAP
jgi:Fe-S-cluster containining protein